MIEIAPSPISGTLAAPPSKSCAQRATLLSALAEGTSSLFNVGSSADCLAALRVARSLGAWVEEAAEEIRVTGVGIPRGGVLDCGESGFCFRAVSAVAALFDREFTVTGRGSLLGRPVGMIEGPLRELGAICESHSGLPPLKVRGPLRGGRARVDGSGSSQFLSGLLIALPRCGGDSELEVTGLASCPYAEMTLEIVRFFGGAAEHDPAMTRFSIPGGQRYRAARYEVEGDWSGAAFLLVAGAIAGEVAVTGLRPDSPQADRAILEALELAGARPALKAGAVTVTQAPLRAFSFDATDCPDLFPPLVALACACEGRTVLYGAGRLRHKESDRGSSLCGEFAKLGARVEGHSDRIEVVGGALSGGEVDPRNDHRIAMACAVAGLISNGGVSMEGEACVSKSYPGFFRDLESLRVAP